MSQLQVDLALVKKYNVPGPRYTSYPPATRFTEELGWADLAGAIRESNRPNREISLYYHIPFCESLCWYCGCNTFITTQHSASTRYLDYLNKEMDQMAAWIDPGRKVVQLHFGGGTPTFLSPDESRKLGGMIHAHFQMAEDVEAGVEIDPRRLTRDHLAAMREIGFNRASLGVQDFDPDVQQAVHRVQPRELTAEVVGWVRELGFKSLNIDLIYGLPSQTVESFERTLDEIIELGPDRLAVFSYAHVPWFKPAQKILEKKVLPTAETKLELLKLVIEKLTAHNRYVYIGMDHFARPDDELAVAQRNKSLRRNFQGYSTRGGSDIYAFGVSSISQLEGVYWQNHKELTSYYAALDADRPPMAKGCLVTEEDKIRRETIMRLMCTLTLDYAAMSEKLGVDFASHFAAELESMAGLETDGLIKRSATGLEVTPTGRLFIRNIAMCFDAYLPKETERRFSRTI